MKSKANIKGHPLHPILVTFPIALFSLTLIFDIIGWFGHPSFHHIAFYLEICGLIGAVAAAIPGLIDLVFTVPPHSTGKKRGIKHGLTNLGVTICFGAALYYRLKMEAPLVSVVVGLETIGTILLFIAGWLGGTLVYRNQIGVDIRYAYAGKWKEQYAVEKNGAFQVDDPQLKINQMQLVHAGGKRIVIAMTENGYVAFSDRCTHRGGSLAGGAMICGTVQCPWHGSQFDAKFGAVKAGPATESIESYPLIVENDKLLITIH